MINYIFTHYWTLWAMSLLVAFALGRISGRDRQRAVTRATLSDVLGPITKK